MKDVIYNAVYISIIAVLLFCWYRTNELAYIKGEIAALREMKAQLEAYK